MVVVTVHDCDKVGMRAHLVLRSLLFWCSENWLYGRVAFWLGTLFLIAFALNFVALTTIRLVSFFYPFPISFHDLE